MALACCAAGLNGNLLHDPPFHVFVHSENDNSAAREGALANASVSAIRRAIAEYNVRNQGGASFVAITAKSCHGKAENLSTLTAC